VGSLNDRPFNLRMRESMIAFRTRHHPPGHLAGLRNIGMRQTRKGRRLQFQAGQKFPPRQRIRSLVFRCSGFGCLVIQVGRKDPTGPEYLREPSDVHLPDEFNQLNGFDVQGMRQLHNRQQAYIALATF
jgi:hypothetical protein